MTRTATSGTPPAAQTANSIQPTEQRDGHHGQPNRRRPNDLPEPVPDLSDFGQQNR
jgi:hypothetical protein